MARIGRMDIASADILAALDQAPGPSADAITKGWFKLIPQSFDGVPDAVYGGDVEYIAFRTV
jgi:hypothetical protein